MLNDEGGRGQEHSRGGGGASGLTAADAAFASLAAGGAAHVGADGDVVLEQQVFEAADAVLVVDLLGVEEDRAFGEAEVGGDLGDRAAGEQEALDLRAALR